jgi:hypothetical protein
MFESFDMNFEASFKSQLDIENVGSSSSMGSVDVCDPAQHCEQPFKKKERTKKFHSTDNTNSVESSSAVSSLQELSLATRLFYPNDVYVLEAIGYLMDYYPIYKYVQSQHFIDDLIKIGRLDLKCCYIETTFSEYQRRKMFLANVIRKEDRLGCAAGRLLYYLKHQLQPYQLFYKMVRLWENQNAGYEYKESVPFTYAVTLFPEIFKGYFHFKCMEFEK